MTFAIQYDILVKQITLQLWSIGAGIMFEKNMRLAYLLDYYGEILDDHTKSIMKAYYEDDLSLSEIAAGEGISRQGVRHVIKKCEEQLEFLESKLHIMEKTIEIESAVSEILKISNSLSSSTDPTIAEYSRTLAAAAQKISNTENQ